MIIFLVGGSFVLLSGTWAGFKQNTFLSEVLWFVKWKIRNDSLLRAWKWRCEAGPDHTAYEIRSVVKNHGCKRGREAEHFSPGEFPAPHWIHFPLLLAISYLGSPPRTGVCVCIHMHMAKARKRWIFQVEGKLFLWVPNWSHFQWYSFLTGILMKCQDFVKVWNKSGIFPQRDFFNSNMWYELINLPRTIYFILKYIMEYNIFVIYLNDKIWKFAFIFSYTYFLFLKDFIYYLLFIF